MLFDQTYEISRDYFAYYLRDFRILFIFKLILEIRPIIPHRSIAATASAYK